jgi:hypothetical protein
MGLCIYFLFKDISSSDGVMSNCWREGGEMEKIEEGVVA